MPPGTSGINVTQLGAEMKTLVQDIIRIKAADSKRADETFEPAPEQYWELLGSAEALLDWAERAATLLQKNVDEHVLPGPDWTRPIFSDEEHALAVRLLAELRGNGV